MLGREDCHPWARSPSAVSSLTLRSRFIGPSPPTDFCRQIPMYGHDHRAPQSSPASVPTSPHEDLGSLAFAPCSPPKRRAMRSEPSEIYERRNLSSPARLAAGTHPCRKGRVKGSRIAWAPLLAAPSRASCRPLAATEDLECPPSRRTPDLLLRERGDWLHESAGDLRSHALPRRSTLSRRPRRLPPFRRPFGCAKIALRARSDSVSSSRRPLLHRAMPELESFLFIRVALRSRRTSAFGSTPRAPKP